MEMPNAILVRKLKAAHAKGNNDDAYFCRERFAAASHDERINLEEQRIAAAQKVVTLYEEAYAEFHHGTASVKAGGQPSIRRHPCGGRRG